MGALPKRKISKARKGKRRSVIKIKSVNLVACSHCGQLKRQHHACPSCGYYKDKEVIKIKIKKGKKTEKKKA